MLNPRFCMLKAPSFATDDELRLNMGSRLLKNLLLRRRRGRERRARSQCEQ